MSLTLKTGFVETQLLFLKVLFIGTVVLKVCWVLYVLMVKYTVG